MAAELMTGEYSSSNMSKHTSGNPLQRMLLDRFHHSASRLLRRVTPAPQRILDAGCGEGFAMQVVFGFTNAALVGLDGSAGALQVASTLNPARRFTAGDLLDLPFPDRSFDLVVCMEVLEHLDDPARGLAELCRVSADWLLLSVPNEPLFRGANFLRGKNVAAWGNDPGHVNHWSSGHFKRFINKQCRVITLQTSFPWTLALCRIA
ncbi:MAG: class I SAM-dependent methyltransferase [Oscillochloris sp.]|nr:class I SAM-dependent methyltransferase [Oscillochloris sp.]